MSIWSFTKLFKSLLDSTLWVQHGNHVKVTWITMMCMADSDGFVAASIPGLAQRAGVTIKECEEALQVFLSPDKYSRTPDHEGRRIREVKGGWELLNYVKKRKEMAAELTRAQKRDYMRRYRAEQSQGVPPSELQIPTSAESGNVTSSSLSSSSSKSDLDPDPERAREAESDEDAPGCVSGPRSASGEPPASEDAHRVDSVPATGLLKPSRRESEPTGARPVGKYEFSADWRPKPKHRARGLELGLTEDEILARAEDCKLKLYTHPFPNEDKQFMRELSWAARDKEAAAFKRQALANRRDHELPGHDRRPP